MSPSAPTSPAQARARLIRRTLFTVFLLVAAWMIVATIVGVFGDIVRGEFPTRGS